MSGFRVTLQFDLDIDDDEQAKAFAAECLHARVQAEGGRAVTQRGESPEVAIHGMAQHMQAAASVVATELLARGAETLPWLHVSNAKLESEPTNP